MMKRSDIIKKRIEDLLKYAEVKFAEVNVLAESHVIEYESNKGLRTNIIDHALIEIKLNGGKRYTLFRVASTRIQPKELSLEENDNEALNEVEFHIYIDLKYSKIMNDPIIDLTGTEFINLSTLLENPKWIYKSRL